MINIWLWSESKALGSTPNTENYQNNNTLPSEHKHYISTDSSILGNSSFFITDLFLWGDFYFLQHNPSANLDTESVSVLLLSLHIQDGHRNRPPLLLRGHPQGLCFFLQCMLSFSSSIVYFHFISLPLSFSYPPPASLSLRADMGACSYKVVIRGEAGNRDSGG